jgi:hypothetical protein
MAERDDCIADILKSIKDRRDRKFVQDHLDELDERASNDSSGNYREALGRAAEELLKEHAVQSAIRRRNMQMDALKARDLRTFVEHAAALEGGSYQLGIEARLVGMNRQFFDPKSRQGNQLSAASIGLGAQKDWIGGAVLDMERAGREDPALQGLDRLFYSKAIDREWAIERYELTLGDRGRPGRTGNPQALAIAKILQKWDKVRVDALNSEGAWISDYAGYVTKTFHDPDRLRKAAGGTFRKGFEQRDRETWAADTANWIDAKRMFGTAEDADKKLAEMYGGLVTGDHLEMASYSERADHTQRRRQGRARRASCTSRMPSRGSPTMSVRPLQSDRRLALQHAHLGQPLRPDEGVRLEAEGELRRADRLRQEPHHGRAGALAIDKCEQALENRFAVVSGEADRPIANPGPARQRRAGGAAPGQARPDAVRDAGRTTSRSRASSPTRAWASSTATARCSPAISRAPTARPSARWRSCCTPASSAGCAA